MKMKHWNTLVFATFLLMCCDTSLSLANPINSKTFFNQEATRLTQTNSSSTSALLEKQSDTAAVVIVVTGEGIERFNVTSTAESRIFVSDLQIARAVEKQWALLRSKNERTWLEQNPGLTLWGVNATKRDIAISSIADDETETFFPAPISGGLHNSLTGGIGYGVQVPGVALARVFFKYHRNDFYGTFSRSPDNLNSYHAGFLLVDEQRSGTGFWKIEGAVFSNREPRGGGPPGYQNISPAWAVMVTLMSQGPGDMDIGGKNFLAPFSGHQGSTIMWQLVWGIGLGSPLRTVR